MFRQLLSHPLALGFALLATLLLAFSVDRLASDEGGRSMLMRIGATLHQQVVVIGHRVVQEVVVIGRRSN